MSTITTGDGTQRSIKDWAAGWFLRVAIAAGFLSAVADRFGLWGPPGAANIDWGAWTPFVDHTRLLTFYLPQSLVPLAAIGATLAEVVLGIWLLVGWRTRVAAYASGALLLTFALSMTLAVGVKNPLNYATFTAAAAAFALAALNTSSTVARMKNTLLKQTTINLAVVSLFALLGACSTTTSPSASKPPLTASRDSSGPVKNPDIILGGTRIPVTTYYDWPPIGDEEPR